MRNDFLINTFDLEFNSFIKSHSKILNFKRGEKIYSQSEKPQGLYFLKTGLVGLTILSAKSGKEHLLRLFKQGQFFGHRALFSDEKYHASAISLEPTVVDFVEKEILLSAFINNSAFLQKVIIALAQELRQSETQHVLILENEILARVAHSIVYLKDLHPDYHWTRQEIANFCASTVSTVIKAMSELELRGLILQQGRMITILNRNGLIALQDC